MEANSKSIHLLREIECLQDDLEEETEHFNGGGSKSKNTMKQMLTGEGLTALILFLPFPVILYQRTPYIHGVLLHTGKFSIGHKTDKVS